MNICFSTIWMRIYLSIKFLVGTWLLKLIILKIFLMKLIFLTVQKFEYNESYLFQPAKLTSLTFPVVVLCCALGFSLSLLFFMDQNLSAAIVNAPEHRYGWFNNHVHKLASSCHQQNYTLDGYDNTLIGRAHFTIKNHCFVTGDTRVILFVLWSWHCTG